MANTSLIRSILVKKTKKLLSILLVLALLLTASPISVYASDDVWDGNFPQPDANALYSGGMGTEEEPFEISSAKDLAQLSVNTNKIAHYSSGKYFLQTADIVLNRPDVFARDENGVISGLARANRQMSGLR
jgi:hypothetical protein